MKNILHCIHKYPHRTKQVVGIDHAQFLDLLTQAELKHNQYIEALTDNRNLTAADLRAAFNKRGGNLGETGCVSWMFAQKGVCIISGAVDEDRLLAAALEGGADVYELNDYDTEPGAEVFTETSI